MADSQNALLVDPPEKAHVFSMKILESHLDTFGHVNNATYLTLYEQARWEWITVGGFGLKEIQERGVGPTILEINIKYKRELKLREDIQIFSWASDYKGKISTVWQMIKNAKGEVASEIILTVALFDVKARRIISPTPEWLSAVGLKSL